ncbi:hypothetical protein J7J13_00195 [bacterium]|nr:hypothetical protein [bacterium]
MDKKILLILLLFFFQSSIVLAEETTVWVSVDCDNVVSNTVRVYLNEDLEHTFTFTGATNCNGSFKTSALVDGVNTFRFGTGSNSATDADNATLYYVNFSLKNPTDPEITGTTLSWAAGAGSPSGYTVFWDENSYTDSDSENATETELDLAGLNLANGSYFIIVSPRDGDGYYGKSLKFKVATLNGDIRIIKGTAVKVIILRKKR